jgi:hypothetical protein
MVKYWPLDSVDWLQEGAGSMHRKCLAWNGAEYLSYSLYCEFKWRNNQWKEGILKLKDGMRQNHE